MESLTTTTEVGQRGGVGGGMAASMAISPEQLGQLAAFIKEAIQTGVQSELRLLGISTAIRAPAAGTWMLLGNGDGRCAECGRREKVFGLFGEGGRVQQTHRACQTTDCDQFAPPAGQTLVG